AGLVGPGTKCIENRLKFSAIPRTVWRGADEMGQPARVRPDPRGYLWRPSAGEIATGKARSTLEVDCRDAFDPTSLLETCGTLCPGAPYAPPFVDAMIPVQTSDESPLCPAAPSRYRGLA